MKFFIWFLIDGTKNVINFGIQELNSIETMKIIIINLNICYEYINLYKRRSRSIQDEQEQTLVIFILNSIRLGIIDQVYYSLYDAVLCCISSEKFSTGLANLSKLGMSLFNQKT